MICADARAKKKKQKMMQVNNFTILRQLKCVIVIIITI